MIAAREAGVAQAIHLSVHELIPVLYPPVSASSDYPASLHKHGADGNSALREPLQRLVYGRSHEDIHEILPG